ncbi:MAG: 16S rRNA (guanine(527)-N(7))-methyltransferase RsmG [Treponema sp.]|nr:16S rRNA (guanine(527)-N(7))-methyltransferase RsmG [Treponema sp.]
MKDCENLLNEGIEILCKSDKNVEHLIAVRRKEIISLLICYIKEIELFNPAYGLVGAADTKELIIKHILDSLAPLGIILRFKTSSIADAGSGAGLPGIPLAITMNQNNITLIERMGRRAGFLLNTKAVLQLSNISIEEKELEKVQRNSGTLPAGGYDLITFRAFKPLDPKLLKTLFKILNPNGIIAAYKGRQEKTENEIIPLGLEKNQWEIIPYSVPFLDEERHLLVIKRN